MHSTEYSTQSHDHHSPISTSLHEQGSPSHDPDPAVVTEDTLSKLYQDDAIGDTVFSKAWVLSTLVEIIKTVEEEDDREAAPPTSQEEKDRDGLTSSSSVEKMNCSGEVMGVGSDGNCADGGVCEGGDAGEGGDVSEGVLELDEEVEGRLCTLWDASMNTVRMHASMCYMQLEISSATVNICSSYFCLLLFQYLPCSVRLLQSLSTSKKA